MLPAAETQSQKQNKVQRGEPADALISTRSICRHALGFGTALLQCCIPEPDVHFELTELRSGGAVEGARCTKKGRVMCEMSNRMSQTSCDSIEFLESAPLQVRKDMLAIAFYRLALTAAGPAIASA